MGNDGGSIPRRDELVRLKKKKEKKDKDSELSFRWRHCSITQQPLEEPIAACGLGRLYKKQAVIEALLEKTLPESASHIKTLKDICELSLTPNPAFKTGDEKGDGYVDRCSSPYICPLSGLEITGRFRFVFLWSCGCVFAERAMKEIRDKICQKCQKPFAEDDIIVLNGTEEEVDRLRVRLEARQARIKAEKKAKSEAKRKEAKTDAAEPEKSVLPSAKELNPLRKVSATVTSSKIVANKVLNGEKRSATDKLNDPAFKKSRDSYSVAADPKASEVFKSLFTSHKTHESQTRAHWVTYNPFYN